ncbi:GNAT family N-acetyltransferase [Oceanicaulis sp. 350]|jgi:predicted GNAT family acetyltransferase|uniref:GNAT family N-acetyltransferase n=1 Tax=Oceanicaulis alexandrii TaxID=153233 RepID=UPI0012EFA31E|nr:GNAT family N-acetyltransferase [Oceanicaulis alexandrii]MBL4539508.1 N-acetyltransferase [Oceanicaulis sp.]VXC68548.1 GNAT family N-acetyltransferase [Oceanicaulis sp. 350]
MTEFTITEERSQTKGRYVATAAGKPEAELTYSIANDHMIIIDHTGVPDEWRGMGVGKALVQRAVEDARERGVQIIPLCPFAKAQINKTPDWHDVLEPVRNT